MKHNIIRFFIITFVLFGVMLKANAQLKVVEGNDITFGTIYQTGEKVRKVITLKNVGTENIGIKSISTSCGCTAALISDSSLAPGKETKVKVEFNPTGYIGDVVKYIYIVSTDPNNQLTTVKITGYIAYALQPTPSYIVFNNVKVGKPDSTSVTLSNTSNETIRITKVETGVKEITFKLHKKVLKPGEFTDLDLYLLPKKMLDINGYMQILTTSKLQPVLQIRVFAGMIGP